MERVVLIGLDGVDWTSLEKAMAEGWAPPFITSLVSQGTLVPIRRDWAFGGPTPWITLATGRPPGAHGVLWQDEAWAGGTRPISQASWRAAPAWSRLEAAGISTASVAWPGSAPAMKWSGFHIDDRYPQTYGQPSTAWSLPISCCPEHFREELRALRVHPTGSIGEHLPFPLHAAFPTRDHLFLKSIERITAEALSIEAAARWAIAVGRCDASFIYFGWMAGARALMEKQASRDQYEAVACWHLLDVILDRVAAKIDPGAHLLLVSVGSVSSAGFVIARRPSRQSEPTVSASLVDIAPTVLALLGFGDPCLPGRPLAAIGGTAQRSLPPSAPQVFPTGKRAEFLAEVVEHGYSLPSAPAAKWRAQRLARLAALCIQQSPKDALKLTHDALALLPGDIDILDLQATALMSLQEAAKLSGVADKIDRFAPGDPRGVLARAAAAMLTGDMIAAASSLQTVEAAADLSTLLRAGGVWLLLRRPEDASRVFRLALSLDALCLDAEIGLSEVALMESRPDDAALAVQRVLAIDPAHQRALTQLQRATKARSPREDERAG